MHKLMVTNFILQNILTKNKKQFQDTAIDGNLRHFLLYLPNFAFNFI